MHLSKEIIATFKPNLKSKKNGERMKRICKKFKIWEYELNRINLRVPFFLLFFFSFTEWIDWEKKNMFIILIQSI